MIRIRGYGQLMEFLEDSMFEDEPVEAIQMSPGNYSEGRVPNSVMSLVQARPYLERFYIERTFDDNWYREECVDITVWTPSFVIYTREYDSSLDLLWLYRNPRHEPIQ